jgi:predicted nucleic acid-binding protein
VAEPPVVNASPLIFLAGAGLLDFLRVIAETVIVLASVADEIQRRGPTDVTAQVLQHTARIIHIEDPPIPRIIQAWDLGEGESAVLAWASRDPGTEAIIDDWTGRRCAAALGIAVRGTLSLTLTAKRRPRVPQA